jgi:cell filamentation protein
MVTPWRDDPYLQDGDDGRPMLRNLVGATNAHDLTSIEYRQTMLRTMEIRLGSVAIPQTRNVQQWKAIHAHLFGGIYEWAGAFRITDIGKRDVDFCPRHYLDTYTHQAVTAVADQRWGDLDRAQYLDAAAHSLTVLNAAHPFREGNGRSTRLFFDQLSAGADWTIDYSTVSKTEWNNAFRNTMVWTSPNIDPEPVRELLDGMIEAKSDTAGIDESMPELMRRVLEMTRMTHLTASEKPVPTPDGGIDMIVGIIGDPTQDRSPEPPGSQIE